MHSETYVAGCLQEILMRWKGLLISTYFNFTHWNDLTKTQADGNFNWLNWKRNDEMKFGNA